MIKERSQRAVSEQVLHELRAVVRTINDGTLRTADHSDNVSLYAVAVAQRLGVDERCVARTRHAATLHDIGKAVVSEAILAKPGALTPDERREIERHVEAGADMLERAGLPEEAAVVRAHHERYDGLGYPAGLAGDEIPLEARIIFAADAFEAMTSDRPYRAGCSVGDAVAELRRCAGSQFDPVVVDMLAEVVAA